MDKDFLALALGIIGAIFAIGSGTALYLSARNAATQIASATERASAANERAAVLEKEAAEARAEQERLKTLVTWRTIPNENGKILSSALSVRQASIVLAISANDPEALFYGAQIGKYLESAGWNVIPEAVSWSNYLPIDMHIPNSDDFVKLNSQDMQLLTGC
jgi:hypothetical protein